jgi:putative toxin-antitoxin system antitoxin component (TIGR02293 family)
MATQVSDLLGGERVLGASLNSNIDLARATREGLPARTAVELAEIIGAGSPDQLSSALAHALEHGAGRLTPLESDAVVRIAQALAKAIDVLGGRHKAAHWLMSPNRALGGETPLNLLDTSAGAYEVDTVLDRIEYGVYS